MARKDFAMMGIAGLTTALFGATLLGGNASAVTFTADAVLDNDITDGILVEAGSTVTIDLNGHSVTNVDGKAAIINKGTLVITGEGSVTATAASTAAVTNYPGAVMTLNGGTYTSSKWYTIRNYGEMTLNDGVVVESDGANAGKASMVTNGWYGSTDVNNGDKIATADRVGEPVLTINGGTYTAGLTNCSVVKNDDYGNLTINNGKFTQPEGSLADCDSVILNWNVATVEDGEFYSENGPILSNGAYTLEADKGLLTVNGGYFEIGENGTLFGMGVGGDATGTITVTNGKFGGEVFAQTGNKFVISGGLFKVQPAEDFLKAGFKATAGANEEGYFEVIVNAPVVEDTVNDGEESVSNETVLGGVAGGVVQDVINAGEIEDNAEIKNDDYTFVVSDAEKLTDALSGDLKLNLESQEVTATDEEQALIDEYLPEGAVVHSTHDVIVVLRDGDENELGRVTELANALKVVFSVENAEAVADGYVRIWKVMRIHNG